MNELSRESKVQIYESLAAKYREKKARLQSELASAQDNSAESAALQNQIAETENKLASAEGGALEPEKRTEFDHLTHCADPDVSATESMGELGAFCGAREDVLGSRYNDYTLVQGFEKPTPQGIDQIKRNGRGDFLIVEAKGGESRLKNTNHGRQMSESWLWRKCEEMEKRDVPLGAEIRAALENPDRKVEGVILATRDDGKTRIYRPRKGIDGVDADGVIDYKRLDEKQLQQELKTEHRSRECHESREKHHLERAPKQPKAGTRAGVPPMNSASEPKLSK